MSYSKSIFSSISILAILPFLFFQAHAEEFPLKLKGEFSPEIRKELLNFLHKGWNELPLKMREGLPQRIEVQFTTLGSAKTVEELTPYCQESLDPHKSKIIYGKNEINTEIWRNSRHGKQATIYLNQLLIIPILSHLDKISQFNCRHRNLYRTAKATLIHELAHIYEYFHYVKDSNVQSDRDFWHQLYNLTYWNEVGLIKKKRRQTNINFHRSPDPSEFSKKEESFPVNLEYFLLDPEYAKRLPTRYELFKNYFNFDPHHFDPMAVNRNVLVDSWDLLNTDIKFYSLDPERFYRADFLIAKKGNSPDTLLGHSMIRLIFCSADHLPVGPHCLQDRNEHLVVSFMAYVNGIILNPLKGLFGGYTTKGVIESFNNVVNEYTVQGDRDLVSLKMEILTTQDEKVRFLNRLAELQASYSSDYHYVSNNCSHETRNFLLQVLGVNSPVNQTFTAIPQVLAKQLYRAGVISQETWENQTSSESIDNDLYILRQSEIMRKAVIPNFQFMMKQKEEEMKMSWHEYAKKQGIVPQKIIIDDYINGNLKALRKSLAYDRLINSIAIFSAFKEDQLDHLADIFILFEQIIAGYNAGQLVKKIGELAFSQSHFENGSVEKQLKDNFREILNLKEKIFIKELRNRSGYGIPIESEQSVASSEQLQLAELMEEKIEQTKKLIEKKWPLEWIVLSANESINKYFVDKTYLGVQEVFSH